MNRKAEMISWLERLEEYAREQKLPMRILDSVRDLREQLERNGAPDQEFYRDIEEILESVERKARQAGAALQKKDAGGVSPEKVRGQMKKMADQCHMENQDSLAGIENKTNLIVRESMRKMEEICHTGAHLDLLVDEKKYLDFFEEIKSRHDREMSVTACALIEEIGSNYNYMTDHLRSMFQSIGGHADGVGSERFYREYDEKKDYLEKRLEGEVRTANFGSGVITAFAKKTGETVREIVKKVKIKKIIFSILPLLVIGIFLFARANSAAQEEEYAYESSVLEDYIDENLGEGAGEIVKDYVTDYVKDKASEGTGIFGAFGTIFKGLSIAVGSVVLFLLLLLAVFYYFYLKKIDKWHKGQIFGKCGEYLKLELEGWKRQNLLLINANQMLMHLAEECERQHVAALNHIFEGTAYAGDAPEETDLEKLRKEWEALK